MAKRLSRKNIENAIKYVQGLGVSRKFKRLEKSQSRNMVPIEDFYWEPLDWDKNARLEELINKLRPKETYRVNQLLRKYGENIPFYGENIPF